MSHGTRTEYRNHLKRGEDPCRPCKDANNEYNRDWRARNGIRSHTRGAPDTIVDVMSTYVHWFDIEALVGRVQYHRPDLTDAAIRRALARLQDDGRVQSRVTKDGYEYYCDEWSVYAS